MFFDELSNDEWALVAALVAEGEISEHRRGRPRAHPRTIVNAVLWILTTGETWSKLPGHYPTVPTCRRRFNDWQMNGTLLEMVTRLAEQGRSFAILPAAPAEMPVRPAQPVYECDRLRGVFWQNPESWGGSNAVGAGGTDLPLSATRAAMNPHAAHAHGHSHSYGRSPLHGQVRETTPMAFEPACAPVHDGHGYAIYAISRPLAGGMFRGCVEIVKDGRRVERSGLIGPRYGQADEAAMYALEWSRRWIASQSTRVTHPGEHRTVPVVPAVDATLPKVDAALPAVEQVESRSADAQR
jgi:transposase